MIKESAVADIWQRAVRSGAILSTVDNQPIGVVYPGRASDEPGSDIKDAVLNINGKATRGNIEIHVHSSDWCKHAHHLDKAYNGNILHVVMFHDSENMTGLENGQCIPIISLVNPSLATLCKTKSGPVACPARSRFNLEKILLILNKAGNQRFKEKQAQFLDELEQGEAGQCLYRGIMGALGYSKNTVPFKELADIATLTELERMAKQPPVPGSSSAIEEFLLKTAGFMTENGKQSVSLNDLNASNTPEWRLFRVRPGNHPARRLAGMARLIARHGEGLLNGLMAILVDYPVENLWDGIETALVVPADGYWVDHYCPGKQCHLMDRFLIGRERALEIVINILLPFTASYGKYNNQPEKIKKVLELYSTYPATEGNNIERHMGIQLGLARSRIKTAQCQQGLLHLYKRFCTQGRCGECPLVKI